MPKTPPTRRAGDPDDLDRLDRQARLLDLALEGLYTYGQNEAIEVQDISLLIWTVMDMQATIARLKAARERR